MRATDEPGAAAHGAEPTTTTPNPKSTPQAECSRPGALIHIRTMPVGKVEVRFRYASRENRHWLHEAVGTRKPELVRHGYRAPYWEIPRTAAERVFRAAVQQGLRVKWARVFRPDAERCTIECQTANPHTVHECVCPCGGKHHGRQSPGWTQAGRYLLVKRSEDNEYVIATWEYAAAVAPRAGREVTA